MSDESFDLVLGVPGRGDLPVYGYGTADRARQWPAESVRVARTNIVSRLASSEDVTFTSPEENRLT